VNHPIINDPCGNGEFDPAWTERSQNWINRTRAYSQQKCTFWAPLECAEWESQLCVSSTIQTFLSCRYVLFFMTINTHIQVIIRWCFTSSFYLLHARVNGEWMSAHCWPRRTSQIDNLEHLRYRLSIDQLVSFIGHHL
jgi:hypothetical protein